MDRNLSMGLDGRFKLWSLSARRAWIEIAYGALDGASEMSLSARRAWIEIGLFGADSLSSQVALRKESVDRNLCIEKRDRADYSRSPQGERG